jgi:hypothetical protein
MSDIEAEPVSFPETVSEPDIGAAAAVEVLLPDDVHAASPAASASTAVRAASFFISPLLVSTQPGLSVSPSRAAADHTEAGAASGATSAATREVCWTASRTLTTSIHSRQRRNGSAVPARGEITQARQRLGPGPVAGVFSQVAEPVAGLDTIGALFGAWRLMSMDGMEWDVPDTVTG